MARKSVARAATEAILLLAAAYLPFAIHAATVVLAFRRGVGAAVLTAATPIASEVYWTISLMVRGDSLRWLLPIMIGAWVVALALSRRLSEDT